MNCELMNEIYLNGLVPIIAIDDAADAVPLAAAIRKGGLNVAEVTFRTPACADAIATMHAAYPDLAIGAGTVTSVDEAKRAVAAGACFIVSPGYDKEVVGWCLEQGVLCVPGIATASEAQAAIKQGVTTLKLYPAEQLGGAAYIKSLTAVFPSLKIMATGGINPDNMQSYLDNPSIFAVGGTWLCPKKLIAEKKFDEIAQIISDSLGRLFDFKLLHIGLNSRDGDEALQKGGDFAAIFNLPLIDGAASCFAGTMMEVVKKPFLGEHGHIAVSTKYIDRAMSFFERRGYAFRPTEGARKDLIACYFTAEVGGFAIHLRRAD